MPAKEVKTEIPLTEFYVGGAKAIVNLRAGCFLREEVLRTFWFSRRSLHALKTVEPVLVHAIENIEQCRNILGQRETIIRQLFDNEEKAWKNLTQTIHIAKSEDEEHARQAAHDGEALMTRITQLIQHQLNHLPITNAEIPKHLQKLKGMAAPQSAM